MKRNILLAVTALMIALAMTACSPNANNQGPIIIGPSGNTNRPMSSSEAARAFADNFSFGAALANAAPSSSPAIVDFTTKPYSYTDAEGNQWRVNDGTLEYTFPGAAAESSVSLLSNGSMTSYTVKTIEPLTIAYSKGSYTLTIGETAAAACDVTISADSVTVNSMTQPSSISINGSTVATPAYTLVGTEAGLSDAIEVNAEIAIGNRLSVASQLKIAAANVHIFGVTDDAELLLTGTVTGDQGLIHVTADNVKIKNLKITYDGDTAGTQGTRLLKATYKAGGAAISGFALKDVTFTPGTNDKATAGINLHGTTGASIENVVVNGDKLSDMANTAFSITDCTGLTITGGSFHSPDKYADININETKSSTITFKDFGDDSGLIFATNPSNGSHDIKGFTEDNTATAELGIASFKISGTYYNASPALVDQIGLLNYFKSFGHKRVMVDITNILVSGNQYNSSRDGKLALNGEITATDTSIAIPLTADGYRYCGSDNAVTISGNLTFTLAGTTAQEGTFTATDYSVSGENVTLSGVDETMTIKLENVKGIIAKEKFLTFASAGGTGITVTTESDDNPLSITISDDEGSTTYSTDYKSGESHEAGSHAFWIPSGGIITTANGTLDFKELAESGLIDSATKVIKEKVDEFNGSLPGLLGN